MKKIKQQLENYNITSSEICDSFLAVVISDVLDPLSEFWTKSAPQDSPDVVPWNVRKDIVQASLMVSRCTEEICMLQGEIQSVVAYWKDRRDGIIKCLEHCHLNPNQSSEYAIGLASSLKQTLLESELAFSKVRSAYAVMTSSPDVHGAGENDTTQFDSDSSNSSDSDSEADEYDDEYTQAKLTAV